MRPQVTDPYRQCPVFDTQRFTLRLIQKEDAPALLECYSDPAAAPVFNSDNCNNNFIYRTRAEMDEAVDFWVTAYQNGWFIRFSIIEKSSGLAAGTIECFARVETVAQLGRVGVLRLDLPSRLESMDVIAEILACIQGDFFTIFQVDSLITKAVPAAGQRTAVLLDSGWHALPDGAVMPFPHYYACQRTSPEAG